MVGLVDQYGHPLTQSQKRTAPRAIRARYDAAATTDDNRRHWANADSLSAVMANSASVREKLRIRSRYEIANNSYARGILNTIAAYTIGQGPTLQLTYRGEEAQSPEIRKAAQEVEHLWNIWAYSRKLTQKLSTMQMALDGDGEAFGLFSSSQDVKQTPVQLDVTLYECDQFESFAWTSWDTDSAGVRVDGSGNPTEYAFMSEHPGDGTQFSFRSAWIPASSVIHLFRKERPGQLRGIPKTTPALPLFALLRRFTLATLVAAETAADFAAILYSEAAGEDADEMEPWARLEIERGAMVTAPGGTRLAQLKAEHPNATYTEFTKMILLEISRCLGVPAVIALGTAENSNYSSARMDLQLFYRQMEAERFALIERDFLDRLFEEWLTEALLLDGYLPNEFASRADNFEWGWRWTQPFGIDRKKEADGATAELANHTTTLAREYASKGLDWATELRQIAAEKQLMRELGLEVVQSIPPQLSQTQDNGDG